MDGLILLLLILAPVSFLYFMMRSREFHRGYFTKGLSQIEKKYGESTVSFFGWGSSLRRPADPTTAHIGIYALISSPQPLPLDSVRDLFDEVEEEPPTSLSSSRSGRAIVVLKKYRIRMGTPEMKIFLDRFDVMFEELAR